MDLKTVLTASSTDQPFELIELRRLAKQATEEAEWYRINHEYKPTIAPTIQALRLTLDGLKNADPTGEILATCVSKLEVYPLDNLDPRYVREAVSQLRSYTGGVKATLTTRVGEIERLLARLENPTPKILQSVAVQTRLDVDVNQSRPYLGIHKGLAGFFEFLAGLESDVKLKVDEARHRGDFRAKPVAAVPSRGDDFRTLITSREDAEN